MGRHHRPSRLSRPGRPVRRHRASALLSAAVLASVAGPGVAFAATDTTGDGSDADGGSSSTALDPAGSALGTATGTDDDAGPDPVTSTVDGAGDATDDPAPDSDPAAADDDSDDASDDDSAGTTVTLAEKNDSGVSGRATVTEDDVVATATGLDPDARYVSFFYGATSSSTNNNPCILDGTNPLPSEQTVGTWTVRPDGSGTLRSDNPLGSRYRLQAGTMSIRKVAHGFSKATALPVNPASYSLVACGTVRRLAALDPATSAVPKLPKLPRVRPVS